jgi:uncharacterized protein (TIGR03118 family)
MRLGSLPIVLAVFIGVAPAARAGFYQQTNLVSDIQGLANNFDPNLKNPWGISFPPGGPFWVSDQGTNMATLYNAAGVPQTLSVTTPTTAGGPNGPTGQVFNNTSGFVLSDGSKALFLFAQQNGTITGWNPGAGVGAMTPTLFGTAGNGTGAVYEGLAIGTSSQGSVLYAADNKNGKIDVFNSTFAATTLAGGFTDPNLPSGFKAYNVQTIGNTVYVTYSSATGGGVVDTFDQNGNFLARIAANDATGPLKAPWGIVIAPSTFGQFANDILVGNNGSGTIAAFDPTNHNFVGFVSDANGNPFVNSGLWALTFGSGGQNGSNPNTLFFTAGIGGYQDGLLGSISVNNVPEPGSMALLSGGMALSALFALRHRRRAARG